MKPRLLRLFVVMLVLTAAFVWLGNWQWQTAHNKANQQVLEESNGRAVEPLDDVLKPQTTFDNGRSLQPIRATGHYDAAKTELVAGRVLDGKNGYWLMTPLVVDTTGARIPVVRGFVTQTTKLPAPTSGTVTIEGALAPGESVSTLGELPEGQIGTIDMGWLLNEWGGKVYNGFVFSTKQAPAAAPQPGTAVVQHIPPPVPKSTKVDLRNAAYAWQWWIFAIFAVFMWLRILHGEYLDDRAAAEAAISDGPQATDAPDVRAARSEGDAADDLDQPDDGAARASSAPETLAEQGAMRPATRKETP